MTSAFYKVAREVDGFDEKLEKFKDELFAFCEQLGYKTKSYVYADGHNRHFVKLEIKNVEPRYGTEFYLKEIISNAEIKNLVIDLKGYVDDLHQEEKPDGK